MDVGRGRRAGLIGVLTAEAISQVGTKTTFVAIPWLVLVTTGDPVMMGVVAAAEMVPYVLAGIFGAPLIDRLGTWRTAVDTDIISAFVLVLLVFTYDRLGIGVLIFLVFITGGLRGLGNPARAVLLRPMIDQAGADVTRITTIYDGIGRLTTLIGAPIAGLMLAFLDPMSVIAVDAATFAASALITAAFVRLPLSAPAEASDSPAPAPEKESYFASLKGGFEFLRQDRLIFGLLILLFVTNLAAQAHQVVFIPLWVSERLGSPTGLGLVFGAFALGAVLGNLVFTAIGPKLPRYLTFTIAYLVGGVPRLLVLGVSDSLIVVMTVLFACGVALSSVNPILGAVLYQRVPAAMQARVFGLGSAFATAGLPIGALLGGWAAASLGLTTSLWIGSLFVLLATLWPFFDQRTWRQMDSAQPVPGKLGPLTITLAFANDSWTIAARNGREILTRQPIDSLDALRKVSMLDIPAASTLARSIVEAERETLRLRAEQLRAELAEAEARHQRLSNASGTAPAIASYPVSLG